MNIKEFFNTECLKSEDLTDTQKANNLLVAVIKEIETNNAYDIHKAASDTVAMVNLMNRTEYVLELMVSKYLLELYLKSGSFETLIIPTPNTKRDNQRYNDIKEHLKSIFPQQKN